MGSNTNMDMAHYFFYKGVGERTSKSCKSSHISYDADGLRCFSYSTVIAKVIPCRGFADSDINPSRTRTGLTLVSSNSMTPATAQHISAVMKASPFDVVAVPMVMWGRDLLPRELTVRMLQSLEKLKGRLGRAENRAEFVRLLDVRRELINKACAKWAKPLTNKAFAQYEAVVPEIDRIERERQAQASVRAAAAAARAAAAEKRAEEVRARWLVERKGVDYLNFLRGVFGNAEGPNDPYTFNAADRDVLRRALQSNYLKAYVWIDGDQVRTSKQIRLPVNVARAALKAWAAGKDMRAFKVGDYAVVSYEGDVIQIGCHHIPRQNMIALYEALIRKPFPLKKTA